MIRLHRKHSRSEMALLLGGLCLLLSAAPAAFGQVPPVRAEFPAADTEVPITRWRLLGPFLFHQKEVEAPGADKLPVGLNRDYLADFGQQEESIDAAAFFSLRTPKAGVALDKRFANILVSAAPTTNILDFASVNIRSDYAIAYVAAVIESPEDRDVVIAAGADDNLKMWLNHEQLLADPLVTHWSVKKFRSLAGARLKKGSNFLLVKVGNIEGNWQLIVTLYPHERTLELANENGVNPILRESVIPTGQPLEIRGDLLPVGSGISAEIRDAHGVVVDSWKPKPARRIVRDLAKIEKDRVYYCRVTTGGQATQRPFYYGDLARGYAEMAKRTDGVKSKDELVIIDLQAQLKRLGHLLEPASRSGDAWGQKVAQCFAELERNFALLAGGDSAFRHAPGTHLRGYRSSVDGQVLHYWVHVPEGAQQTGKPVPLVIALPYTGWHNLPFLGGYQLAPFDEVERYRVLGDQYGLAVLQVWGRGNFMGGTAIWSAEVLDALEAVRKDYPIDPDRIYLVGSCEGGRQALLLGERYPERFAAIAVEGPIIIFRVRDPHYAAWAEYSSPIANVGRLVNTPVFISHGVGDDNPPIQESEFFASRGRAAGVDVTLVRTEGGVHGFWQNPMAVRRSMFEFLKDKRRTLAPRQPSADDVAQRFGIGRGPIEDAFGAPVLIVEGTAGAPAQQRVVRSLVQELLAEWKNAYFVDCPMKRDADVSDGDIRKYNLVLVGDNQTNSLLKRMADSLPLREAPDHVDLGGKTYGGAHIGFQYVAPNPLDLSKYVVVIGMSQWAPVRGWRLHPSRQGICDYFVFDLQGPAPQLRDAGYFDATVWQKSTRHSDETASSLAKQ